MDSRDIEKWRIELDSYANVEDGVEYWLARDLMEPMGYTRWENFAEVVKRAKVSHTKQTKLQLIPIFVTPRKW